MKLNAIIKTIPRVANTSCFIKSSYEFPLIMCEDAELALKTIIVPMPSKRRMVMNNRKSACLLLKSSFIFEIVSVMQATLFQKNSYHKTYICSNTAN